MKILLIGTGGVGEAVARIASQRHQQKQWLTLMVLSDYNLSRAQEVAEKLENPGLFCTEQINARNKEEIVALIRKHDIDLVFNACDPSFNETIFDAAFACSVHYLDMALTLSVPHPVDPYHKTHIKMGDYQFAKHDEWAKKDLLALVGMGMDPGGANVFAKFAEKHFFDEIEEVSVKDGGNLSAEGYDITFGFSIWTTIDECLNPPFVWEQEKGLYTKEPFSDPELFTFPDGIGEQELVNVEHEELVMMPKFIGKGCKKISFKYGLGAEFITMLKNLKALRLDDKQSILAGTGLSPRDVVARVAPSPTEVADKVKGKVCVGTYVSGKKDGLERKVFLYQTTDQEEMMARIGCGAVVGQTAYNPVIALELLAEKIWTGSGVLCPEQFDPDPYIRLMNEYDFYAGVMELDSEFKTMRNKQMLLEAISSK